MSDRLFDVLKIEDLVIDGPINTDNRELMSPYVWRSGDGYRLLLRAVPYDKTPTGLIWCGSSSDGLTFTMADVPAIVPSLEHLDIGGCEDPTVIEHGERLLVYYTGVDRTGAAEMLWASGTDAATLEKHGVAYHCSHTRQNTKEATVEIGADGVWRLFFEYSREERSWIGLAFGRSASGPWEERPDPMPPRDDAWDCWHLSTGPMIADGDDLIMFYNGATKDTRWAIGWAKFKRDCRSLIDRCDAPLIAPEGRDHDGDRDIAFANSALVEGDLIHLYYSHDDRTPRRATLRRR